MSYKLQVILNDLKNQIEKEHKQNVEFHGNFSAYLEDLLVKMYETPADNLDQEIQRTSCIVLVEEIQRKYQELTSNGLH